MSVISVGTTSTTAFKVTSDTTGTLQLKTADGATTALDISAAGNVGVGASTTAAKLEVTQSTTGVGGWAHAGQFTSASYPLIRLAATTPNKYSGIGNNADGGLTFTVNGTSSAIGTEAMYLNPSGNLGLGVTPSAWLAALKVFQIGDSGSMGQNAGTMRYGNNFYIDTGGTEKYIRSSSNAHKYIQDANGGHAWYTAPSGTAGNAITFTQAMTLNTSGNLQVGGTTTGDGRLYLKGSTTTNAAYVALTENSAGTNTFYIRNDGVISTGVAAASPYNNTTASAANVFVDSAGVLARSTSSLRYKNNVQDAVHGLSDLLKLRSVTYKGNNDGDIVFGGLIAEEVDAAGLTEFVAYNADGQPDAIYYGNMVALCIKAIQELEAEVATLKGAA